MLCFISLPLINAARNITRDFLIHKAFFWLCKKAFLTALFPNHYGKTTSQPHNQPQDPERSMVKLGLIMCYLLDGHPFLHSSTSPSFQPPEIHLLLTSLGGNFVTAPLQSFLCTGIVSHPWPSHDELSLHTAEVKTSEKAKIILFSATHPDALKFINFTGY